MPTEPDVDIDGDRAHVLLKDKYSVTQFHHKMGSWSVKKHSLEPPTLEELGPVIQAGLATNFTDVSVEVTTSPDLRLPPFHLAAEGISGNERIADIGGPPYLHPFPKFDRKYSMIELMKLMEMGETKGFVLGAGAGPFHVVGVNSELVPNLSYENGQFVNLTHIAKIDEKGGCVCEKVPGDSKDCALMANLFGSDGRTGKVLKITAKKRTGKLDFISTIQNALKTKYGDQPVSMGGVFVITNGKAILHVMPDFSKEPMEVAQVKDWLKFFEMASPLICLTAFHSYDPGLDLRMEHTHCFSQHGEGGHYHYDSTPADVQYEAYLNTAKTLYRIDQPTEGNEFQ